MLISAPAGVVTVAVTTTAPAGVVVVAAAAALCTVGETFLKLFSVSSGNSVSRLRHIEEEATYLW